MSVRIVKKGTEPCAGRAKTYSSGSSSLWWDRSTPDRQARMTPDEIEERKHTVIEASEVPALVRLRQRVGQTLGEGLVEVGQLLHVTGHIFGPGRIEGSSKRGNGDDETVAVGVLLQVGGELTLGALDLFARGQNYAA